MIINDSNTLDDILQNLVKYVIFTIDESNKVENIDDWLNKVCLIPPVKNNMISIWNDDSNKYENLSEFMWDKITDQSIINNNSIYTVINTDDGDYLIKGYHIVNKEGYFVSKVDVKILEEGIIY